MRSSTKHAIALAGIGLTAVLGFFHYITKGPNEVSEEDDAKADQINR